ncbi:MAG: DUF4129 domain-containing protein [Chloroflexota bacterium]
MRRWTAVLALLAICAWPGLANASTEQARAVLERGVHDLDHAATLSEPQRTSAITSIVNQVRGETSLGIGPWLLAPLDTQSPDLPLARTRFSAALEALSHESSGTDLDARRQALRTVLGGSPFQTRDIKGLAPEWLLPMTLILEWLIDRIGEIIRWPFDRLGDAYAAFIESPAFLPVVTLLALGAIVSLVMLYRRGLRAALVSEAAVTEAGAPLPLTSAQAVERAQRYASESRFREACHFVFLSAMLWIEERGVTHFDQSATNWEHLQRLDRQSPVSPPFRGLVDRFDRLWYGQADVSAADYRDLEELALRVRKAAV